MPLLPPANAASNAFGSVCVCLFVLFVLYMAIENIDTEELLFSVHIYVFRKIKVTGAEKIVK